MDLAAIWPYALAAVLLLALIVLVLLVLLLRRSAKATQFVDADEPPPDDEAPPPAAPPDEETAASLGSVFRRARRLLGRTEEHDRYRVPVHLLLGADGSREATLLQRSGSDLPFGPPADTGTDLGAGRGFWFFDRGVVLDVAGPHVLRADGRTSDERGWESLMRHLQKLRPRRPLDGAIVTISCAALLDGVGDAGASELAERMTRIHRKLASAQHRLGFRLPAYVVVTGCDALTGFTSLCTTLPPPARREMLGWSSPYTVDLPYRPEWVAEAFDSVGTRLDELQMEIFAEGTAEAGPLLQLPAALRGVSGALRVALEQLFRPSAYHGQLMLRGIYFCGGGAFFGDVLDRKVFAESGLAVPTSRTIAASHRTVFAAQIAVASLSFVFAAGLLWAWLGFRRQNETLVPFLQQTRDSVVWVDEQQKTGHVPEGDLKNVTLKLLAGMARINFRTYGSAFVPSSWFTSVDGNLRAAVSAAFRGVIFRALRVRLGDKAREIVAGAEPMQLVPASSMASSSAPGVTGLLTAGGVDADAVVRVEQLPDFQKLQHLVTALRELEENGRVFNELCKQDSTAGVKDLGAVITYTFGTKLPDSFYSDAHLYEQALEKTAYRDTFVPRTFHDRANSTAEALAANVFTELYERNPLLARLQELWTGLQELSSQTPHSGDTEKFRSVARQMRAVEVALSRPGLEWAFRKDLDLGPAFTTTLGEIKGSAFLGPDTAERIVQEGREGLGSFQRLLVAPAPLTGSILAVRDGRPEMQLSPDALLLKSGLETFLVQGFVSSTPRGRRLSVEVPPGRRLVWDTALLEQAAGVAQAYDRFREKNLALFPNDVRLAVDQVARERARGEMLELMAMAQRFEPAAAPSEEELRAQITTFAQAMPPLNDVLDGFTRLGYTEPRRDVALVATAEGARLLQGVDGLLAADAPYRPRQGGFSWWDGSVPPSPAAWDAHDGAELALYLDTTRGRIALLARNYAQPLLNWLRKAGTSDRPGVRTLAIKWQGIIDDLAEYDAKKPGNAAAALDDYVTTQLAKVRPGDCAAAAVPAALRADRGFFGGVAADLSRDLTARCYRVAGGDAALRYAGLARFFNQRLAGRYPFAGGEPKSGAPEAEPADVRAFFKLFDASEAVIRAMPAEGALGPARKWVEQMAAVRKFFAPFLDAPKSDAVPAYDVEPTFRILREREVDGDQIIAWSLTVGGETATNRKPKKLRWTPGMPVQLSLRWAAEAARVPFFPAPRRGASVHDRTVTFDYTNRWSLLSALAAHGLRAEELPSFADVEPIALVLSVPTRAAAGGAPSPAPARVFLRLALLAPGTTQTIDVPSFSSPAPKAEEGAR